MADDVAHSRKDAFEDAQVACTGTSSTAIGSRDDTEFICRIDRDVAAEAIGEVDNVGAADCVHEEAGVEVDDEEMARAMMSEWGGDMLAKVESGSLRQQLRGRGPSPVPRSDVEPRNRSISLPQRPTLAQPPRTAPAVPQLAPSPAYTPSPVSQTPTTESGNRSARALSGCRLSMRTPSVEQLHQQQQFEAFLQQHARYEAVSGNTEADAADWAQQRRGRSISLRETRRGGAGTPGQMPQRHNSRSPILPRRSDAGAGNERQGRAGSVDYGPARTVVHAVTTASANGQSQKGDAIGHTRQGTPARPRTVSNMSDGPVYF